MKAEREARNGVTKMNNKISNTDDTKAVERWENEGGSVFDP
jgi:hypothetical protein